MDPRSGMLLRRWDPGLRQGIQLTNATIEMQRLLSVELELDLLTGCHMGEAERICVLPWPLAGVAPLMSDRRTHRRIGVLLISHDLPAKYSSGVGSLRKRDIMFD